MGWNYLVIYLSFLFITTGCGLKQSFMGEFYLSNNKYKDGIIYFQKELRTNSSDAKVNYYLGRYYLADKQPESGLFYLKKAVGLDSYSADYQFWLGVAYAENRQPKMERKSYEKALKLNPKHLNSRIYLAHSQLERKLYREALSNYSIVLEENPDDPACLYNRALALGYLQRTKEEKMAWKAYLDSYPSGPIANIAAEHLNSLGDFSYRNHIIGIRTITVRKLQFEPFSAKLTSRSKQSLDLLGEALTSAKNISVHIIVYQKNNEKLAEEKAKNIKRYLTEQYTQIGPSRIKVSWFDVPESIKVNRRHFKENESINFFTAI